MNRNGTLGSSTSSGTVPLQVARPKWPLYAVVFAVLLVVNGIAYRMYRSRTAAAATAAIVAQEPVKTAPVVTAPVAPPTPPPDELARAHRVSGLAALEQGDYSRAVKEFTKSAQLGSATGDLPELLRIARDLEDRSKKQAAVVVPAKAEVVAVDAPKVTVDAKGTADKGKNVKLAKATAPDRKKSVNTSKRRASETDNPASDTETEEAAVPATLLVTSTPIGLVVELDGTRVDLTPARLTVDPGPHSVVLLKGDTRLYEKRVSVATGAVLSIDPDLSNELRPSDPPQLVAALDSTHTSATDATVPQKETAREKEQPANIAPIVANTPVAVAVGEVYVVSPEIYGEIFINGKNYGYPPLVAKDVTAGKASVEVRVNGSTRRSMTVDVNAQRRVTARVR